ncbi:hypothetical protein ACZ90_51690 [Streptomyces albus subsp. albus]|nr:hypothetical protein ACZ90_51690 [Streptomyces albus subsp. albus]
MLGTMWRMTDTPAPTEPCPADRPGPPPVPSAPPAVPRRSLPARSLVAGLLGAVLGAALVGLPWLLGSDGDDDRGGGGGAGSGLPRSSGPLTPPAKLGAYDSYTQAAHATGQKGADKNAEKLAEMDAKSAELLSQAYGGAKTMVARYADADLDDSVQLVVVRASSPDPFVPYEDAAYLGLAKPNREVVRIGKVACTVYNQPTNAGQRPTPESVNVELCQRTGDGLTVQVRMGGGDLRNHPDRIAELVETAWSQVS